MAVPVPIEKPPARPELACGHRAPKGGPGVSNPDRWWCAECRAWRESS